MSARNSAVMRRGWQDRVYRERMRAAAARGGRNSQDHFPGIPIGMRAGLDYQPLLDKPAD